MYKLLSLLCVASYMLGQVVCNDNLKVAYQWKQVDYEFTDATVKKQAIESKEFIPENVIPVGLEVYKNRLFITLPRWKAGVPATLTYIDLNGKIFHSLRTSTFRKFPNPHSFTFTLHFYYYLCFEPLDTLSQFMVSIQFGFLFNIVK